LIVSHIMSMNTANDWDQFWKNSNLQKIIYLFRKFEIFYYLNTILKKFKKVDSFCELGCGSSILLSKLSKNVKKVVGIDYSSSALKASKNFFNSKQVANFELIQDDVTKLKTKKKFDVVFSNGLVEHFSDPLIVIDNHVKITKKGGSTIILVPLKHSFKYIWFLLSKINRKLWPWPDQIFFTTNSMKQICKEYYNNKKLNISIKNIWLTANVLLGVKKTV